MPNAYKSGKLWAQENERSITLFITHGGGEVSVVMKAKTAQELAEWLSLTALNIQAKEAKNG